MKSYIKNMRLKLGRDKFMHPAARIIIENDSKQVLIIERKDNGRFGIPAGSLEEDETIEECITREVREETGLKLLELQVIGISSNPDTETVEYINGDKIQYFTIEFYSNLWEGVIEVRDKKEVTSASFKDIDILEQLPKNYQRLKA